MEAKNFRTGNLISYENLVYKITAINAMVDSVYLNYPVDNWVCISKIKPIPLTEKWLIKFGFYQEEINDSWNIDIKQDVFALDSCLEFINYEHSPLNYVHELQNLFFAITGQELELKDKNLE